MKHIICDRLARMASAKAQERFITNGSAEAYYLPEELLEDAAEVGHLARQSQEFSDHERAHIETFIGMLDETWPSGDCPPYLSPRWCAIRAAAAACLRSLNYNLAAWESTELNDTE